jgi:hypothetical protein
MPGIKSSPEQHEYEGKKKANENILQLSEGSEETPLRQFQAQIRRLRPKHQQLMNDAGSTEERDAAITQIKKDFKDTPPPADLPDLTFTSKHYVSFTKLEGETVVPEDYNLKITKISKIYTADLKKAA